MAILKVANVHFDAAGTTRLQANGANVLTIVTGNTEDARFDASGNLLIGRINSTVGQGVKLDVAGAVNASAVLINGAPALTGGITSNVVISVADNTNAALRITQTGTGEAIRVEDSANPDSTPLVVDAAGRLLLGNNESFLTGIQSVTHQPQLQIHASSTGPSSEGLYNWATSPSGSTVLTLNKSVSGNVGQRGALTGVSTSLGSIVWNGDNGTSFLTGSYISSQVDATPAGNSMPGRISFHTTELGNETATERMRIQSTGNVLINRTTSTVGQDVKLDVNGAINASAVLVNGAPLQTTSLTSNVVISVADNTNAALRITQTGTGEAFRVEDAANPDATAFTIDSNGVVRSGNRLRIVNEGNGIEFDTGANSVGYITNFLGNTLVLSPNSASWSTSVRLISTLNPNSPGDIQFWTGDALRCVFSNTGNVLIGRTDSTVGLGVKLDVNGAVNASALYVNGTALSGGATVTTDSVNATRYVVFEDSTSGTMTLANVSTSLTFNPSTGTLSSTVFNSTSDETLKYNVQPIDNALGIVDQINGVSFTWKESGLPSLGVIAQDIEKVLPELVGTDGENKTVNYNGIIAVLIEAIKELSKRVEELESK